MFGVGEPLEPAASDTRSCEVCGEEFASDGKVGPGFLLGRHRWQKHQIKADGTQARKPKTGRAAKNAVSDEDMAAQPVLSIVRDAASEVSGRGAPTAEALAKAFGRALHLSTMAGASYVVESDANIPEGPGGDALRDRLISGMSMSERGATSLFRPATRPLAKTKFNQKYGRDLIENVDIVGSVSEVAMMIGAWRSYYRDRNAFNRELAAQQPQQPFLPTLVPDAPPVMTQPAPAGGDLPLGLQPQPNPAMDGQPTSPAPTHGVLMTPELVAQIRARNA